MNPVKYLTKDLINKPVPFDVWLQGKMERTIGDHIIISDSTGDVKIKPGEACDFSDITVGDYCCVIGVAVNTIDMPEVKAAKFFKVNSIHQRSWESEVQEAHMLLEGMIAPKL